ncbi:MAG: sigma-54-dependent transcriptional regulator [Planctomycetota bacterium]
MKILLAEDEKSIRITLADELEERGHEVDTASDGSEAVRMVDSTLYDLVISDIRMPGVPGTELLRRVKEQCPDTEVIMITGVPSYELAIECIRNGAYDFIPKPFNTDEIINRLQKLAEVVKLRQENRRLRGEQDRLLRFDNIVGGSRQMQRLFDEVRTVAGSDIPILLHGESGTGKELFARALHANSPRAHKPMVTVACHVSNENLLESDLFGHVKGAYTGADTDRDGSFVRADGGIIFLDDIDDMPMNAQAKLLRALQFGEVTPLGWKKTEPLKVNVRVVAATKVDLRDLIEEGQFRDDLYYRISTLTLDIPPLRQRLDDIPHLVHHFIQTHGNGEPYDIADDAMMALRTYHWPGNIRELEQMIRAAIALSGTGRVLRRDHFRFRVKRDMDAVDEMTGAPIVTLAEAVAAAEKQHIVRVMKHTDNNTVEAARLLSISRKNLWEKRKKYELDS